MLPVSRLVSVGVVGRVSVSSVVVRARAPWTMAWVSFSGRFSPVVLVLEGIL